MLIRTKIGGKIGQLMGILLGEFKEIRLPHTSQFFVVKTADFLSKSNRFIECVAPAINGVNKTKPQNLFSYPQKTKKPSFLKAAFFWCFFCLL